MSTREIVNLKLKVNQHEQQLIACDINIIAMLREMHIKLLNESNEILKKTDIGLYFDTSVPTPTYEIGLLDSRLEELSKNLSEKFKIRRELMAELASIPE